MQINTENADLELGDAQFLVGIVLASEGYADSVASSVIGLNALNIAEKDKAFALAKRKELEDSLKATGLGMIRALLEYLWSNKIFAVNMSNDRVNAGTELKSLADVATLPKKTCIDSIYAKCIQFATKYPAHKFILLYMDTPMFRRALINCIKAYNGGKSADNVHRNVINDQIVDAVLADYKGFVNAYSSGKGNYHPNSGTPDSYLCGAFKSFYAVSRDGDHCNYEKIMNSFGQNTILPGSDAGSELDNIGISDNEAYEINFTDVVKKISKASEILFRHANGSEYLYDIYSYHRDTNVKMLYRDFQKVFLKTFPGCRLDSIAYSYNNSLGHEDTIKNKIKGKLQICDILEEILKNGLSKQGVYPMYRRFLKVSMNLTSSGAGPKNGSVVFPVGKYNTKDSESSGEKLQILIEGYLALKKLLQFLNSSSNRLGITENSFPVTIFREAKYLYRFKTFDDYIQYLEITRDLVSEVDSDNDRKLPSLDGIYSNDAIYFKTIVPIFLNSDKMHRLRNTSLSFIPTAVNAVKAPVEEAKRITQDTLAFAVLINDVYANSNIRYLVTDEYAGTSEICKTFMNPVNPAGETSIVEYLNYLAYCEVCYSGIVQTASLPDNAYCKGLKLAAFCIGYVNAVMGLMQFEGKPVIDEDGNYLLNADSFEEQFAHCNDELIIAFHNIGYDSTTLGRLAANYNERANVLKIIYELFTGEECHGTQSELYNTFNVASMLYAFISELHDTFSELNSEKKDIYINLAKFATKEHVFMLPKQLSSCNDIAYLFNKVYAFAPSDSLTADELGRIKKLRNEAIVKAFNNMLTSTTELPKLFSDIRNKIDATITCDTATLANSVVEETLIRANKSLILDSVEDSTACAVKKYLETIAEFDKLNYVTVNGVRYCLGGYCYYHKFGYKVIIDKIDNSTFTVSVLNKQELEALSIGVH